MRTVLIISKHFSPSFNIAGKRAYRFAKHLQSHGWRAIVWTSPLSEGQPVDDSQLQLDQIHVEPTYGASFWSQSGSSLPLATGGLKRRLKDAISIPIDKDIWLTSKASKMLKQLCLRENVDVIFASSSPYSALIQAWAANRMTDIPFCLDLRDPWSLNIIQKWKPLWVRFVEQRIEKHLFRKASRVVLTCEDASNAYRSLYPKLPHNRITTITNSFDSDYEIKRTKPLGPITLIHFGNCYGLRSLKTILLAIAKIRDSREYPKDGIRLINYGRVLELDVDLAKSLNLEDVFQPHKQIDYEKGLVILAQADLLMLPSFGEERLFIPGKTFDYLFARTPILCLANPCQLTRLIKNTCSGSVVSPSDVDGAADAIKAAISARNNLSLETMKLDQIKQYDSKFTTAKLAAMLDEVADEGASR
jgi:glycosyltransferase involved in cell wall biosynthesis